MKVTSLTSTGTLDSITLNSPVFGGEINPVLMAQAVRVYQANSRQGTSKTKTRGQINRTKKKWFKQKHTGNARHGARTPNIFVGGGVSHGPTGLENWSLTLPQRMKRQALHSALTTQKEQLVIAEALAGDNRAIRRMLQPVISDKTLTLVVLPETDLNIFKAVRNMPTVRVVTANRLTVMDVAVADTVVMTPQTVSRLEERLLKMAEKPTVKSVKAQTVTKSEKEVKTDKVVKTRATKTEKSTTKKVSKTKKL